MEQPKKAAEPIAATKQHCAYCFDVLIAYLNKKPLPEFPKNLPKVRVPLFVTWNVEKGDELRGCIGTFEPGEISHLLSQYALISSQEDTRFRPVKLDEVKELSVSVSLLVNFQKRKDAYDWELGKNGIIIKFTEEGEEYEGTFLPEVATEQNWDKDTTLKYLIRKAGYNGNFKNALGKIDLETYESSKCSLSYADYKKELKQ